MPVPTNKYGKKTMFGHKNNYGYRAICNDLSVHKKKIILSIMDWMLSDEGQTVMNYGLEGTHYEMKDGVMVSKLGKNTSGYEKTLYDTDVAPGVYRLKGLVSWSTKLAKSYKYQSTHEQMINAWPSDELVLDPLAYANAGKDYALTKSSLSDMSETAFKNIVSKTTTDKRNSTWNTYKKKYNTTGSGYISAMNESAAGWSK